MSPIQSPIRKRVVFSSTYRREELCYCTEELGSESISNACTVPPAPTLLQSKGAHGLEAGNGENNLASCSLPKGDLANYTGDISATSKGDFGGLTDGDSYDTEPSCLGKKSTLSSTSRLSTHVRTFPPPLSSLLSDRPLMRSFKSNGRFVLQREDSAATSTFRVIREDGRLRFELTSPYWPLAQEVVDEDEEESYPLVTKEVDVSEEVEEVLFSSKGEERRVFFNYPMWVPRNMKLFSYWNTASKCLPTLDFLIMTEKLNNMASACSSYERWDQTKPKLGTNMGTHYMQDHLGTNYMQDQVASSKGLQKSREKKTIVSATKSQQGYAIISWRLGLIFLLLESSSVGFQIKGVYYYNYTKLGDQGGKIKGSMQHDLVSNFSCVKESSLENYCHLAL